VIGVHEIEFGLLYDRSVWENLMVSKEWCLDWQKNST
jgi:hypothetical protein